MRIASFAAQPRLHLKINQIATHEIKTSNAPVSKIYSVVIFSCRWTRQRWSEVNSLMGVPSFSRSVFFFLFSPPAATVLGRTVFFVLAYLSKKVIYQEPGVFYHSMNIFCQDCLTLFVWDQLCLTENHQDNYFWSNFCNTLHMFSFIKILADTDSAIHWNSEICLPKANQFNKKRGNVFETQRKECSIMKYKSSFMSTISTEYSMLNLANH